MKVGDLVRNPFGGVGIVIEFSQYDVRNVHAHFPNWNSGRPASTWTGWMCRSHLEVVS